LLVLIISTCHKRHFVPELLCTNFTLNSGADQTAAARLWQLEQKKVARPPSCSLLIFSPHAGQDCSCLQEQNYQFPQPRSPAKIT
jgi:hypothetical protein